MTAAAEVLGTLVIGPIYALAILGLIWLAAERRPHGGK